MLRQDQAVALAKESLLTLYGYKDVKCSACYYELDQKHWVVEFILPVCVLYVTDKGAVETDFVTQMMLRAGREGRP